uniref:Uncharacterized protein n=1 Tax=Anguilla anguilla TaxID=7936 RepID=A0A0E9XF83_ANGAN
MTPLQSYSVMSRQDRLKIRPMAWQIFYFLFYFIF